MQFKHPEILFALLLLIIPIIVHLFQLQRFVKTPFTNVKFLQKIEKQTRKSARLKKWLILLTRMLAFTFLIIAFAEPYKSQHTAEQYFKTQIYLDNSFSMEAKGSSGELLKGITQNLIDFSNEQESNISILTNDEFFENTTQLELKNTLLNIKYSSEKLDYETILLQLNRQKNNSLITLHKNILISDFQYINFSNKQVFTNVNTPLSLLKTTPVKKNNIFIDSVFINRKNNDEILINVQVKSIEKSDLSIPVSLFNEGKLIGKTSVHFDDSQIKLVQFSIPKTTHFLGKVSLSDATLRFDNDFYFTISEPTKTNVFSIENTPSFLSKIYTKDEFNYTSSSLGKLNYNDLKNQQLIILNELDEVPLGLSNTLQEYCEKGGDLVIIPSSNINLASYNQFLHRTEIGKIQLKNNQKHQITTIIYEHPLLQDVFEKEVFNFQYPLINSFYSSKLFNGAPILKLDNNSTFISAIENKNQTTYWISAPINKQESNFSESSLIVPIFYNFAKHSLKTSDLYYILKPNLSIDVKANLNKDEVLKVTNEEIEFIPLQEISASKVKLDFQSNSLTDGFYKIMVKNEVVQNIAINYNRDESLLSYADLERLTANNKSITTTTAIDEILDEIRNEQKINWLFKWFLAFSVLFLFIEILILKYFNI